MDTTRLTPGQLRPPRHALPVRDLRRLTHILRVMVEKGGGHYVDRLRLKGYLPKGGMEQAAEIVLSHEEQFDGTGYPRGLKGEQISLGARLFALIDTLDAMTSDRSYRKALSFDQALAEIIKMSCTQFDPVAVQAFLAEETTLAKWWHRNICNLTIQIFPAKRSFRFTHLKENYHEQYHRPRMRNEGWQRVAA